MYNYNMERYNIKNDNKIKEKNKQSLFSKALTIVSIMVVGAAIVNNNNSVKEEMQSINQERFSISKLMPKWKLFLKMLDINKRS